MTVRTESQTKVRGVPIGYASGLAIRMVFLRDIEWSPPDEKHEEIKKIEDCEMQLQGLAGMIEGKEEAKPLCAPIASFYRDITQNEDGARRLPIVAACVAPRGPIKEDIAPFAAKLRVLIPGVTWSEWEGEAVHTQIVKGHLPVPLQAYEQPLPPLELICDFADTMAFFGSGRVAYTLSIIFQPASFPPHDAPAKKRIPVFPTVILSLLDLARSSERSPDRRPDIKLAFVGDSAEAKSLDEFVFYRLSLLANLPDDNHKFRMVSDAKSEYCNIFRGILSPMRHEKKWGNPKDVKDFVDSFTCDSSNKSRKKYFTYDNLQSATCEIIEFSRFARLQEYIAKAKKYEAKSDAFGKGIAGLAQNVIDFDDQDDHEVSDSLFAAGEAGGYLHFITAKSVVRFYHKSRSFKRMQYFIGGDPYFILRPLPQSITNLTAHAADRTLRLKTRHANRRVSIKSTMTELAKRYKIFAAHLRPMI